MRAQKTERQKFFTEKGFERHIKTLPIYSVRRENKYEYPIKEYLIKNRSASLADIVKGCRDHGVKLRLNDPASIFYKTLKNMIKSGQVTKDDDHKIYFWNYTE